MRRDRDHSKREGWSLLALAILACSSGLPSRALAVDDCPDALITADVKSRLLARMPSAALKINVETDACVVTLKGCADSADRIKKAIAAARKVKKARSVKSQLSVCSKESK